MAGNVAIKGRVRLYLGTGSAETQPTLTVADKIASAKAYSGFDSQTEEIDTTTFDDMVRTFEPGFTDNGTVVVSMNLTASNYADMKAKQKDGLTRAFGIAISNAAGDNLLSMSSTGWVQNVALTGTSLGEVLGVDVTIRVVDEYNLEWVEPTGE